MVHLSIKGGEEEEGVIYEGKRGVYMSGYEKVSQPVRVNAKDKGEVNPLFIPC